MHCQICDAYSNTDIGEFNEVTGKFDYICGKCNDSHHDSRADYESLDEEEEDELLMWEDDDDTYEEDE